MAMKNSDVKLGSTYLAKITNDIVAVTITEEVWKGDKLAGWKAKNTVTGKTVRIKSARKLRGEAKEGERHERPAGVKKSKGQPAKPSAENRASEPSKPAKKSKSPKAPKEPKEKKLSLLDAAAKVVGQAQVPLNVRTIYERVLEHKLWTPGAGKTPEASLSAAMQREVAAGKGSRFKKTAPGLFAAA